MKVKLDQGAKMPTMAHPKDDAGWDLYAMEGQIVPARGSAIFDTGVHIKLPFRTAGVLISKSGLNVKHNITSTGLIDPGYTGSIRVKLYNHGDSDYEVKAGDKISQLMLIPFIGVILQEVDDLGESDRGEKGFGSSGR